MSLKIKLGQNGGGKASKKRGKEQSCGNCVWHVRDDEELDLYCCDCPHSNADGSMVEDDYWCMCWEVDN